MRNSIFCLYILAITNLATAQQKYYTFSIDDKIGIVDNEGNEIIKPSFKYADDIDKKNEIHLKKFSSTEPDVIFNTKTGQKKEYESIYSSKVKIQGVRYSEIATKNKNYLVSQESDHTINLTRKYSKFHNCGLYILEEYSEYKYPAAKPSPPVKKTTSGVPPPPPPIMPTPAPIEVFYFGIINNDPSFKTIKRVVGTSYLPLYKIPEEDVDENGNVLVSVILHNIDLDAEDPFDYIIFSEKNKHQLFDGKLKLIKTFTLANADEKSLLAFAKKTLNVNLSRYSENNFPPPPMMAPSSNSRKAPEIEYPFYHFEKLDDGTTAFSLQQSKEENKQIFTVNEISDTKLNKREKTIGIKDKDAKWYFFNYDAATGKIFLPKLYVENLGINFL